MPPRSMRPARVAAGPYLPLLAALLTFPLAGLLGGAAPAPVHAPKEKDPEPVTPNVEVRFTDGSLLKVKILDADVPLKTPYGKLVIPVGKVTEIECATRLPVAVARRIKAAIARLGSEDAVQRVAARTELARLHAKAYPALLEAEKSDVAEVRRRARELLEAIRESVSEEDLEARPSDVVSTADSKIAGRIEVESLRAETTQFGEVRVRLSEVRAIRSLSFVREKPVNALADPGYLNAYQNQIGQVLKFKVVGTTTGVIYGTKTYTIDSVLATAAVHAGVVKAGQTGIVKVKILGQGANYVASVQHGIQSQAFGPFPGYEILKK